MLSYPELEFILDLYPAPADKKALINLFGETNHASVKDCKAYMKDYANGLVERLLKVKKDYEENLKVIDG